MAPSFCMCPLAPDLIVSLFLCFFVILSCSFSLFGAPCFVHLRLLPCPVPSILFNNKKDVPTSSLGPLETGLGSPGLDLAVRSFVDIQRPLTVRKRLGMEKEQLLDALPINADGTLSDVSDGPNKDGLWGKITNIWHSKDGGANQVDPVTGEKVLDKIHVFSLASGHLYERLLRIMMSSVTKRTSGTVKFWLVENFLSPQFKMTMGEVAKELGCEVGLVRHLFFFCC